MSSSTPSQEDLETSVLLMLAEQARLSSQRLTASTIARRFRPQRGEIEVRIALEHLSQQGLVRSNFDNPKASGFEITRKGILTVEANFEYLEVGENTEYRPKQVEEGFIPGGLEQLASEGTYVFPPIEDNSSPAQSISAPIVIHNHVAPVINNTVENTSSTQSSGDDRLARSGVRAGWFNVWIALGALILAGAALWASFWIAGKTPF